MLGADEAALLDDSTQNVAEKKEGNAEKSDAKAPVGSALEVKEMFDELAKGRDYITKKQLLKWDEIKELIESDLVSAEVIEGYLERLNVGKTMCVCAYV